ncbi:pyridoxal phosphate-dependent decarboxylase family protein [Methylobacillus flagellatus]|uniref:pyridoxal phosphate-dependent decarboxylase family protein n=1 Tax=Methylobacillus flagellatus TaxID=405 RepID=UPI0025712C57|nr:pyridoxal-dependent decarboxylase [Methylobacillus flagellatus]
MTKSASLAGMFSPEMFRLHGHRLIDLLADRLSAQLQGQGAVLPWRDPVTEDTRWQQPLPQQPTLDAEHWLQQLQQDILPGSLAIHHVRNMGHQVAAPLPMAALCDLVASLSNQAMAVYEAGPTATMLERQVIRWLSSLVGWDSPRLNGLLTSGGNQANLTALLAARQRALPGNSWQQGMPSQGRLCILASAHSHYCISRAAGIMGLGTSAVITVACDAEGRMQPAALQQAHAACVAQGQQVMAVVASAACTPTGSIDPLGAIGLYCQANQIWLHVDGAHGASGLLSARHRSALDGIALADSVVWDGHKLLYMPATVSAVLFRDPANRHAAFAQEASYLFQGDAMDDFNTSTSTLECTKRMMGLKLWTAFSLYGVEGLGALVDQVYGLAQQLAHKLTADPAFELLMQPQTNIVCFRHRCDDTDRHAMNAHQTALRQRLVQSGAFHITQVTLDGQIWLRTALMNPFTSAEDLDALLAALHCTL